MHNYQVKSLISKIIRQAKIHLYFSYVYLGPKNVKKSFFSSRSYSLKLLTQSFNWVAEKSQSRQQNYKILFKFFE